MSQVGRVWDRVRERAAGDIPARCARAYFETVYGEYRLLGPAAAGGAEREVAAEIEAKYRDAPGTLTMADALLFEQVVVRLLPEENLRRKVLSLRDRYRTMATADEYQAYAATGLLDPAANPANVPGLRAEAEELVSRFQRVYATAPFREEVQNALSGRIATLLVVVMAVPALWLLFVLLIVELGIGKEVIGDVSFLLDVPSVVVAIVAGCAGGFLSVQQRIQSAPTGGDAIRGALSLNEGSFSVHLSPVTGALFAVLLYLLLIAGLLSGDLFPKIIPVPGDSPDGGLGFRRFLQGSRPAAAVDYAKLIVWAFIAGFAERLIPDTLNRLAGSVRLKESAPAGKPGGG